MLAMHWSAWAMLAFGAGVLYGGLAVCLVIANRGGKKAGRQE